MNIINNIRYKQFLSIGLMAIAINCPINVSNAKDNVLAQVQTTNVGTLEAIRKGNLEPLTQTHTPIKKLSGEKKNAEPKTDSTFKKTIKVASFVSLGVVGLGIVGLTYFFVQLAKAGTATRSPKEQNNYDFTEACYNGNLEKVKYFLNEKSADINYKNDLGLQKACSQNHLEITKYLLTSPELKKHSKIHANDNYAFKAACTKNHAELIHYLIFEYRIPKDRSIKKFIKDNPEIAQMFEKRDLNDKLNSELKDKDAPKKRNKI